MITDRGSVVPWVVTLVGAAALLAVATATFGQALVARSRATAAADAAALAAAAVTFRPFGSDGDPATQAADFAHRHGADLVWCDCANDPSYTTRSATVKVRVVVMLPVVGARGFEATSRAELVPRALLAGA